MIKLSCRSCGAKLELTDDIDRFSCAHCGTEWIVNRSGGIVSLKGVEESLGEIKEHTEKIQEASSKTAEHTELLASEVRKTRLLEKYQALNVNRATLLNTKPKKENPDYIEYMQKYGNSIASNSKFVGIGCLAYFIALIASMFLISNKAFERLFNDDGSLYFSDTEHLLFFGSIMFFVVLIGEIIRRLILYKMNIKHIKENIPPKPRQYIADEEKQKILNDQINTITKEMISIETEINKIINSVQ